MQLFRGPINRQLTINAVNNALKTLKKSALIRISKHYNAVIFKENTKKTIGIIFVFFLFSSTSAYIFLECFTLILLACLVTM